MSETALVLAGHGSHISPRTAGIVWDMVDQLRGQGAADEVAACFWKEPPAYHQVLDTLMARRVFVVPVFTAQGFFTRQVIPAEMGLTGAMTRRDGKTIRLTPTLGQHPVMAGVVRRLTLRTLREYELDASDCAVAVIGHGTPRDPQSRDAARDQARQLRQTGCVREVVDVYLDDEPAIPSVYASTSARNIIALPFFLAPGSHVSRDLPRALGMDGAGSPQTIRGRQVYYTAPVGLDAGMPDAILQLAYDSGMPERRSDCHDAWRGFPTAGREALLHALDEAGMLRFGETRVTAERVWHGKYDKSVAISSPAELRAFVREQPFRPLPTADDMPGGWHVALDEPAQAHAVLETLYPGLTADWAAANAGKLKTETLAATSARQVGMFKQAHRLAKDIIETTLERVCGPCIRQPTWHDGAQDGLPCKAACNLWLSTALKIGEGV